MHTMHIISYARKIDVKLLPSIVFCLNLKLMQKLTILICTKKIYRILKFMHT